MATVVTIDSVTTADAVPATAPHRISNKAGKDTATLAVTPTHDGVHYPGPTLIPPYTPGAHEPIIAVRICDGGTDPYSGKLVGRKGLVCSESEPCSEALACTDWESASGAAIAEDVTYAEEAPQSDGTRTINVWVCTDRQGWS